MFKLQQCYKSLQKQLDQLINQLNKRLEELKFNKLQFSVENETNTIICSDEFILFIRKVWEELRDTLQNANGKARFTSFVRGTEF